MSDRRFSAWHVLAISAVIVVIAIGVAVGGSVLAYQLGRRSAVSVVARAPRGEWRAGPGLDLPGVPFPREVFAEGGPFLGVEYEMITPESAEAESLPVETGALIVAVAPDSPADEAGLAQGDIIQKVDGEPVDGDNSLRDRIAALEAGDEVVLTVLRDDELLELTASLGSAPVPPGFDFELRCRSEPCPFSQELSPTY